MSTATPAAPGAPAVRTAPGRRAGATVANVLTAGALAGALDLVLAWLVYVAILRVTTPRRVLQSIAAGVLGQNAFSGGAGAASLGALLHLLIACIWAAIFRAALDRSALFRSVVATRRGAVTTGLAYGAVIWAGMKFVVVPLSRAASSFAFTWTAAMVLTGHMVLVGVPMVLVLRNGGRAREARDLGT